MRAVLLRLEEDAIRLSSLSSRFSGCKDALIVGVLTLSALLDLLPAPYHRALGCIVHGASVHETLIHLLVAH